MTDEMQDTYTYTARNIEDPDRMVTFTLSNGNMHLNLTGIMEQLGKITGAEEKRTEAKEQLQKQAGPAAMKMAERFSGPVHVADVDANLDGERLRVSAWQRTAGLRLVPISIDVGRVDNVEAADAFIHELDERKTSVDRPSKFFGPLDYWLGWAAVLLAFVVLLRWPGKQT